jgi:hypothetical protein
LQGERRKNKLSVASCQGSVKASAVLLTTDN